MKRLLTYTIGSLQRDARQLMDNAMQPYELSRYEWLTMLILKIQNGTASQSILKEYMGIDDSYLSKVLDKLEQKDLIQRAIDPNDRRSRLIEISSNGTSISENIFSSAMKINDSMLCVLSMDEREQLYTLLHKVHDSLQ